MSTFQGRQPARTALAWHRSVLALVVAWVIALQLSAQTSHTAGILILGPAAVTVMIAHVFARKRTRELASGHYDSAFALVTISTLGVLAVAGFFLTNAIA